MDTLGSVQHPERDLNPPSSSSVAKHSSTELPGHGKATHKGFMLPEGNNWNGEI